MGKLGKRLKRRANPVADISEKDQDKENDYYDEQEAFERDIQVTTATLERLLDDAELFNSKRCRNIRSLLHTLYEGSKGVCSISGRISNALREQRWKEAIYLLEEMRDRKQIPKL